MKIKTTHTTHIEITGIWTDRQEAIDYAQEHDFDNIIVTPHYEPKKYCLNASKPTPKGISWI